MRVRRQLVVLASLALVAAGAARGTPVCPTILTVEPRGGHGAVDPQRLNIVLDLRGEASAPAWINIEAPRRFLLEPQRDPGAPIGAAEVYLRTASEPLVRYTGTISAAPIAAAPGCGSGELLGAWVIRATSRRGKTVELPMSVMSAGATRLYVCPSAAQRVHALALSLDGVTVPEARGSYLWRAFVTPRSGREYEVRALVPVPHVLTLKGAYRADRRRADLTGTLHSHGKARPLAEVDIVRLDRTVFPLAFYDSWDATALTTKRGSYRVALSLLRTQGFVASTPATLQRCRGASRAPGGCRTATVAGTQSSPITVSVP